jgi:hypothetical protein
MTLNAIKSEILSLPTVINLKKELEIMEQLMNIDNRELVESDEPFAEMFLEYYFSL